MHQLKNLLTGLLFFVATSAMTQPYEIRGYIRDAATDSILVGAQCFEKNTNTGGSSDENGFFRLLVNAENALLAFEYVGYTPQQHSFFLEKDTFLTIRLTANIDLNEVVVRGQQVVGDALFLPLNVLNRIPLIGGENDILKSLAFYPGISNGYEGSSNIYIRGGSADQNLILLDGIPIYNPTHLGGVFSIFNPQIVRDVSVYKGNFSARYGGRTASVVAIETKRLQAAKRTGSFNIGLVSTQFTFESPLKNKQSQVLFSARSSYLGWINALAEVEIQGAKWQYQFYDLNGKASFELKKGALEVSVYNGRDVATIFEPKFFSDSTTNHITWGNTLVSARYRLPLGERRIAKITAGYTKYQAMNRKSSVFDRNAPFFTEVLEEKRGNALNDWITQIEIDYQRNKRHFVSYGAGVTAHHLQRETSYLKYIFSNGNKEERGRAEDTAAANATEWHAYFHNEWRHNSKLAVDFGLRATAIAVSGRTYTRLEPRFRLQYDPKKWLQLTATYLTTQQYAQTLPFEGFGFPAETWIAASNDIAPQFVQQGGIGSLWRLAPDLNLSVEGYYKKLFNLLHFPNGNATDYLPENLETELERDGKGEAFGMEVFLEKQTPRWTAQVAYTLARSYRQFEGISNGTWQPFVYDRRHDVAATAQYKLSEKWRVSANLVLQSGTAVLLPTALVPLQNGDTGAGNFEHFRMPIYHRLDVGFQYQKKIKNDRQLIWSGSIYNVYNQKNATYLRGSTQPVYYPDGSLSHYKYAIQKVNLFPIIPSINLGYIF